MGGPPPDRSRGPRHVAARRIARASVPILLAIAALPGSATAATEAEALAAATTVDQATLVPSGWTGAVATCTAGTESAASTDATLQAINAYRAVAGLAPVVLDPAASPKALQAALMMRAGNEGGNRLGLSHAPDPSWPCHSADGASGAATSNLALGGSGAGAITMYVHDDDVDSLGHRRWVLDPGAAAFATGSTGRSNALVVLGLARTPVPSGTRVPWPPAGAIARSWIPERWSLSIGGTGDAVAFSDPVVTMTLDGSPITVAETADLGTSYGTGRTLAWTPTLPANALHGGYHELAVSITGASVNGLPTPISYTTTVGTRPAPPPTPAPLPPPTPAVSAAPLAQLPGLRPRITVGRGRMRIGRRLTVTLAQGTGRIATQYQWLRGTRPIRGATAVHHRIGRRDLGRTLRVRVTSEARDGSSRLTETSAAIKIRRR